MDMEIMNRTIVRNCNETEINAADCHSQKIYDYSLLLFDKYGGIKEKIAEQLRIEFEEHLFDIAFVMRLVIYPKFRGGDILKELFQFARYNIGQLVLFVGEAFPLQYETKGYRGKKDGLDKFSENPEDFKKLKAKLKRHYIKNGLISIPASKELLFLVSPYVPNPVLDVFPR